jgi:hypothetical protein
MTLHEPITFHEVYGVQYLLRHRAAIKVGDDPFLIGYFNDHLVMFKASGKMTFMELGRSPFKTLLHYYWGIWEDGIPREFIEKLLRGNIGYIYDPLAWTDIRKTSDHLTEAMVMRIFKPKRLMPVTVQCTQGLLKIPTNDSMGSSIFIRIH